MHLSTVPIPFRAKKHCRNLLVSPVSDVTLLRDRQSVIAHFCDDTCVHGKLIAALKNFSKDELNFNKAFAQTSSVENVALEDFYFSSDRFKQWNESPIALELGQVAHFANLMSSSVQHLLTMLIFDWGLGEKHDCGGCPSDHAHDHHHHHHIGKKKKHDHAHAPHEHGGHDHHNQDHGHDMHNEHGHDHHNHDHDHDMHNDENKVHVKSSYKDYLKRFLFAWHGIAQVQDLYSVYTITRKDLTVIKELQQQLMTVARGLRTIKSVHALLKDQQEITSHLMLYHNLDAICLQASMSKKLDTLLELLEMPTFKGEPSVFSRTGNILAAYKLLQEVAEELQPALCALGEIDACSSCAQLMTEHQAGPLRYTFAQYEVDHAVPCMHVHNFWHPLMNACDVTLNSLSLGFNDCGLGFNDCARNALLTGPNACGKSTNLKSVTLCMYLAQTLAIVPAEKHCQTVFKEIFSSMIIADQLQRGKSLFVTELESAQALLDRVETLAPGECMFVALDELFKSTQHEKGQAVAYQLLKKLHACPQVITVATTHFEKLAEFAQENPLLCTNYTVQNYRLIPGIGGFDDMGNDNYFG